VPKCLVSEVSRVRSVCTPFIRTGLNSQGAKVPGNEKAMERIGQGPIGIFAPGRKLARERKGSVPWDDMW